MANQTYSTRKVTVGTVKKSMAGSRRGDCAGTRSSARARREPVDAAEDIWTPCALTPRSRACAIRRGCEGHPNSGSPQPFARSGHEGPRRWTDAPRDDGLRQPRPVLAEPGPMPADHCLRLYEQKDFGPSHPDSTQGHPEHSVSNSDPWTSAAVDEGG